MLTVIPIVLLMIYIVKDADLTYKMLIFNKFSVSLHNGKTTLYPV